MPALPGLTWDFNVIIAFGFGLILILLIGRLFLVPIKFIIHLVFNALVGGLMLWVVDFVGAYFGFAIAINPITALIAGVLGIPGVILLIAFKILVS